MVSGDFKLYIMKNNPPVNGSCVVSPTYGVSLVNKFYVLCDGWEDPEEMKIKQYVIMSRFKIFESEDRPSLLILCVQAGMSMAKKRQ